MKTVLRRNVIFLIVSIAALCLCLESCATVGRDFPSGQVSAIKIRQTTRDEIQAMFGQPWRVGIEDGHQTWTYGKYRYSLFSETRTKDLIVRFDDKGIVTSYSFNETKP